MFKIHLQKTQIIEHKRYEGLKAIEDDPAIKAVIVDFCSLCDWTRLALAISCLDRKEVLYMCGCREEWLVYHGNKKILGICIQMLLFDLTFLLFASLSFFLFSTIHIKINI